MKQGDLIVIKKTAGEGKIPIGYEAGGLYWEHPTVGKKFRVGGFTTAEVVKVDGDKFDTLTSSYELIEGSPEHFIPPLFGKVNTIFDEIKFDDSKGGFGIYGKTEESRPLSEKMTAAYNKGERDKNKALRILLPTLTVEEIAFLVGAALTDGINTKSEGQSGSPKSLEDLLKLLKKMRDSKKDEADED